MKLRLLFLEKWIFLRLAFNFTFQSCKKIKVSLSVLFSWSYFLLMFLLSPTPRCVNFSLPSSHTYLYTRTRISQKIIHFKNFLYTASCLKIYYFLGNYNCLNIRSALCVKFEKIYIFERPWIPKCLGLYPLKWKMIENNENGVFSCDERRIWPSTSKATIL